MDAQRELLRQFVEACKVNPEILHKAEFAFYREYLESLGATIPSAFHKESHPMASEETKEMDESDESEQNQDESDVEIDMSGVIEGDNDEPLAMGDENKEATDEDIEKANEFRSHAMSAISEGDFAKAVEFFTSAIEVNPGSAILHAKRASALLELNKPVAAIRDCDRAIALNSDSAQGYKFRGRAYRLLGKFVEAHRDLATACKLDYDDNANEWLKEVEPNAKKILEHQRNKERAREEKEQNKRQERVKRAQEAHKKAAEQQKKEKYSGDDGSTAGGIPEGFAKLFNDPEVLGLLKDEAVMAAYTDIMKNPSNIGKYLNNPKVLKIMEKLGAFTGAFPTKSPEEESTPTHAREPMPDLD